MPLLKFLCPCKKSIHLNKNGNHRVLLCQKLINKKMNQQKLIQSILLSSHRPHAPLPILLWILEKLYKNRLPQKWTLLSTYSHPMLLSLQSCPHAPIAMLMPLSHLCTPKNSETYCMKTDEHKNNHSHSHDPIHMHPEFPCSYVFWKKIVWKETCTKITTHLPMLPCPCEKSIHFNKNGTHWVLFFWKLINSKLINKK